jgi:AraC family L-rhamnose operon transcriptional activator RhaR
MDWIERLNAVVSGIELGEGNRAAVLGWNYQLHLKDNQPHRHTYFEICLVGGHGSGEFRIYNQEFVLSPGAVFFARPGAIHQIVNRAEPLMELYWIGFSLEIGGGEIGALLRALSESQVAIRFDGQVTALWMALRAVAEGDWNAAMPLQLRALSQALLLAIANAGAGEGAPPTINVAHDPRDRRANEARVAAQYIHDNLGRKLSLAEIANYLHVSPRHLARLFNEFTGISVAAYIERARLDRARILLIKSDKALKEVAREVGFEDVAHFNRVFARGTGVPPGEFRRRGHFQVESAVGKNIQNSGDFV